MQSEYRLQQDYPGSVIHCSSNRAWDIVPELRSPHFAVVIGTKEQYLSGIFSSTVGPNTTLLILVEGGREGTFRNIGYTWADDKRLDPAKSHDWRITNCSPWYLTSFKVTAEKGMFPLASFESRHYDRRRWTVCRLV